MERGGAAAEDWPTSEEEDLAEAPGAEQQEQQEEHQEHRLSPPENPEGTPKDVASRVWEFFRGGQVGGFAEELKNCTTSQLSHVIQKVAADTQCEKRKKHEKAKMIEHLGEVLQALGAREAGEVINVKNEGGYSPIAIASKCKNHRLMHVLAQTNVCDLTPHQRNQDTIMHCLLAKSGAVEPPVELYIRCLDVIKAFPALRAFLTHQLARACYKTGLRKYPIHYLADNHLRASFVRPFLQAIKESGPGALEVRAQTGETALLYHVRVTQGEKPGEDYEPTLRLFVEGGCDLYAKDVIGRNALHIALERCSSDVRSKGPTYRGYEVHTYISISPIKLVAMLLELDVDRRLADLPDDMGITPRDHADMLKVNGARDSREICIIIRMMNEHKSGTLRKRNHDPDARRKGARERKRAKTKIAAAAQDHDAPQSHVLEIEDDEAVEREVKERGRAEEAEEEEEQCVEASRGASLERDGSSAVPPSAADGCGSPMSPRREGHASTNAGLSRPPSEEVTHPDWDACSDHTSDTCTAVISMSSSASPSIVRESSSLPTASQQARARTSAAAVTVGVNRIQSGIDAANRGTRGAAAGADVSSHLERLQQKLAVVEQARTRAIEALNQGIDQADEAVRKLRDLQVQMQDYEGLWHQLSPVIIGIITRGVVVEVNGLDCVTTRCAKVYCALHSPASNSSSGGGDASVAPLSIDGPMQTAEAAIAHLRELAASKTEALRQVRDGALFPDLAPYRMLLQRQSESIQQVRHASRVLLSRELSLENVKKAVELETFLLQDSREGQSQ